MSQTRSSDWLFHLYMAVFLLYMLLPLVVMGGAAFNDFRFPSVYPWVGFTDRWFVELWNDGAHVGRVPQHDLRGARRRRRSPSRSAPRPRS